MTLRVASGLVCVLAISACGGGGSSPAPSNPTSPTPALTIAAAAPAIAEEIATSINAALRAGTAAAEPPGVMTRLLHVFMPVTLHAQGAAFTANCRRGGNVNIRYTGSRPVVLTGTSVVFANCGVTVQNRDVTFSADLNSNGYWTVFDPGPVVLNGSLNVNEIGAQFLNGSVNGQQFGGTIGGVTVGTPDTNPPPTPNTCPGTPSRTAIADVSAAGFTYVITLTVGATCPWSVTAQPAWVNVSQTGGRGTTIFTISVAQNGGAARSGVVTVNGQQIAITQLGTGAAPTPPPSSPSPTPPTGSGQDASLGAWTGTVSVNQPCGQLFPGRYNWRATITRSGSAYSMALFTDFSFETRNIPVPVVGPDRTFEFSWNDPGIDLILRLRATFAADFLTLSGPVNGTIICNPSNPPQTLSGEWTGRRTGS